MGREIRCNILIFQTSLCQIILWEMRRLVKDLTGCYSVFRTQANPKKNSRKLALPGV